MARKQVVETDETNGESNGDAVTEAGGTRKRQAKAKIAYLNDSGECKLTDGPNAIRFDFANGRELILNAGDVPTDTCQVAMVRGLAEKVRDTYAGSQTVDEAYDDASAMIEKLLAGEWLSEREGGGPGIGLFMEALQRVKEGAGLVFDIEAAKARYSGKEGSEARKSALLGNAQLRGMYATVKAERAAANLEAKAADAPTVSAEDL